METPLLDVTRPATPEPSDPITDVEPEPEPEP
eukprot:COSAG02_NODE_21001_length_806_cov_2.865629_1_plen_31_part_01